LFGEQKKVSKNIAHLYTLLDLKGLP